MLPSLRFFALKRNRLALLFSSVTAVLHAQAAAQPSPLPPADLTRLRAAVLPDLRKAVGTFDNDSKARDVSAEWKLCKISPIHLGPSVPRWSLNGTRPRHRTPPDQHPPTCQRRVPPAPRRRRFWTDTSSWNKARPRPGLWGHRRRLPCGLLALLLSKRTLHGRRLQSGKRRQGWQLCHHRLRTPQFPHLLQSLSRAAPVAKALSPALEAWL
jgi:hypothetical protein